jgi:hypothetical protein
LPLAIIAGECTFPVCCDCIREPVIGTRQMKVWLPHRSSSSYLFSTKFPTLVKDLQIGGKSDTFVEINSYDYNILVEKIKEVVKIYPR